MRRKASTNRASRWAGGLSAATVPQNKDRVSGAAHPSTSEVTRGNPSGPGHFPIKIENVLVLTKQA